ncbi:hypothetical protein [Streptomyces sp. NBC_01483]|uniref:hypothetical protein n=1 Tax=Streptomyces sp. NBC_01483 TaxID=2903883 RepID=UPI002E32286A|nr:hypothetical protein [Streptomyces sp. NBC_01483]
MPIPSAAPSAPALMLVSAILAAVLIALITAITAGFLAHWDGSSLPGALMRAGGAFAVALTVLCGIIALGVALPI